MAETQSARTTPSTLVILVTGHPATGKTTLAHHLARELGLPFLWRDRIKELLLDLLAPAPGESGTTWSRRLGAVSWTLFYQQVETLLEAGVAHVAESNFDPAYANSRWQALNHTYAFRLVQVRCATEPETLLARYRARIAAGERHPGHVDDSENPEFLAKIRQGPPGWVALPGERVEVDTTNLTPGAYETIARALAARVLSG